MALVRSPPRDAVARCRFVGTADEDRVPLRRVLLLRMPAPGRMPDDELIVGRVGSRSARVRG
jgi:hypothetical protein